MLIVDLEKCIGCKLCEKVCPFAAIVVLKETKKANVLDNCNLCGSCVNACRYNALKIERKAISEADLAQYQHVFVWAEWEFQDNKPQLRNVALELLGQARQLADKLGQQVAVILPGYNVAPLTQELIASGADKVYVCENEALQQYSTDGYTLAITTVIAKEKPAIVLFGATPNGRDLAPRVAARLGLGLTADCTGLAINDKRQLMQTRPAFGGNIMATILSPYTRPQMSTVRPNVFAKPCPDPKRTGETITVDLSINKQAIRTKIIEEVTTRVGGVNIEEAKILVSVGRGIGSKELIETQVKELAELLGGTVSGSRVLVEMGWIPQPQQVGQSGKTVSPELYIALGISGAIQHLVGMSSAKTIIAINKDPEAPIFRIADFGIVGDIHEILPQLISQIKARKQACIS